MYTYTHIYRLYLDMVKKILSHFVHFTYREHSQSFYPSGGALSSATNAQQQRERAFTIMLRALIIDRQVNRSVSLHIFISLLVQLVSPFHQLNNITSLTRENLTNSVENLYRFNEIFHIASYLKLYATLIPILQ